MEGGDTAVIDAPPAEPAQEGEVDEDGMREAEKFDHPAEYWLACIGYAVGFGNIWRFPYMAYTMGGAAFLIPYFISLFFIAMPMYMIETLFGQLIRTKLNERYGSISKQFWGIAITQAFVGFFTVIYYVTLMAWSFSLFFDSWKSPFPWVMSEAELAAKKAADAASVVKVTGI
jgi:SNF family Na+-dependent transporter